MASPAVFRRGRAAAVLTPAVIGYDHEVTSWYLDIAAGDQVDGLLENGYPEDEGRLGLTDGCDLLVVLRRALRYAKRSGARTLVGVALTDELADKYVRLASRLGGKEIRVPEGRAVEINLTGDKK